MSVGGVSGTSSFISTTPTRSPARVDNGGDEASESAAARATEARSGTEAAGSSSPDRGGLLNISV